MSHPISALISELIRTANQIDRIGEYDRSRILELAIRTIKNMTDAIGYFPNSNLRFRATFLEIQTAANLMDSGRASDERVQSAFLEAADMLRTLKILLDARDEVHRT